MTKTTTTKTEHLNPEIVVERETLFNRPGGATARRPFVWLYRATGPDGRRFDNRSIVSLRSVLRLRYGPMTRVVEPWKCDGSGGSTSVYSGDAVCIVCDRSVRTDKYGTIRPHEISAATPSSTPTATAAGSHTHKENTAMTITKNTAAKTTAAKATAARKPAAKATPKTTTAKAKTTAKTAAPKAAPKTTAKPAAKTAAPKAETPKLPTVLANGRTRLVGDALDAKVKELVDAGHTRSSLKLAMREQGFAASTKTLIPICVRLFGTDKPNQGENGRRTSAKTTTVESIGVMKKAAEILKAAGRYSGPDKVTITKANAAEIAAMTPEQAKTMVVAVAQPEVTPIPKKATAARKTAKAS